MDRRAYDLIIVGLMSVMVTSWLTWMGYCVHKDRELKRQSEKFRRKIQERADLDAWEGEAGV